VDRDCSKGFEINKNKNLRKRFEKLTTVVNGLVVEHCLHQ
jgi:hypothetical protein